MNNDLLKGYIHQINNSSGFIYVDGGKYYFFKSDELVNCGIRDLTLGDVAEFVPIEKGRMAKKVRIVTPQSEKKTTIPDPGIHPTAQIGHFNRDEKRIIENLSKVFFVTNGGEEFKLGTSTYRYCLVKPTDYFIHSFHLSREIVVVFSDYLNCEPRSLDAADHVYKTIPAQLRLDKGCNILISHDDSIESKLVAWLKDSNVNQIVIPFTYDEMMNSRFNAGIVQERFRKYLFDNDLFYTANPIENDIFFFGRRDLVHDIVSKCKDATNCGVFGLRRSGKTSVLYMTQKLLQQQSYPTVFIPCQGDLHTQDWRTALCTIVKNIAKSLNNKKYSIDDAAYQELFREFPFENDMNALLKDIHNPITIMFDEIEKITFGINQEDDYENPWLDGRNYEKFWNQIRGYQTKNPKKISILVAGTNPMINEVPTVGRNADVNPMQGQLSSSNQGAYLQSFSIEDTKNMVNTLGGYMGLSFDEYSISKLTSDCGGHPYLMRLMCSYINRYVRNMNIKRPMTITRAIYDKAAPEFEKSGEAEGFFLMILNILQKSYPSEFNTLKTLALEGDSTVAQIKTPNEMQHLLGYGLVEHNHNNYAIKYNTITSYLRGEYKFERTGLTIEEQKKEINLRLDSAEIQLRKIVRNTLHSTQGTTKAKALVISSMKNNKAIQPLDIEKAKSLTYSQLFDTSINKMYFSVLTQIITDNFSFFQNVFDNNSLDTVRGHLREINYARRCPDHSYEKDAELWSWENFSSFRESISWLESILKGYE